MTSAPTNAAQPKNKAWHNQFAEDVLTQLGSSATGLSTQEAAQRLAADGANEIKEGKRISPVQIFLGQFRSILIWVLIAGGAIGKLMGALIAIPIAAMLRILVGQVIARAISRQTGAEPQEGSSE